MRVAVTSLYLPSGSKIGVGYQVHHFANQLVARGHEVTVFSQSGPSADSAYAVEVIPPRKSLRTFGFAWDLRGVDFSGFDVLHACGDDWFLWGRRLPRHIHTYHGSCLAECFHARQPREKARMLGLALCETASTQLCDEAVVVSKNTLRFMPWVKRVIPNGVDLSVFKSGDTKYEAPAILFVGTMRGRKRGEFLLRIFKETIQPKIPEARLWMVCDERVEVPGVEWFGRVSLELLAELYRRAWVFCLPSTYEGFGIPYVEAMASGTAVVASSNAGAREVTEEGKFGMICADAGLGRGLMRVLEDPDLRKLLERRGRKRAEEFGWEAVCSQYERLYRGESGELKGVGLMEGVVA